MHLVSQVINKNTLIKINDMKKFKNLNYNTMNHFTKIFSVLKYTKEKSKKAFNMRKKRKKLEISKTNRLTFEIKMQSISVFRKLY